MKGDFTRSTFRREEHYCSVRLQQGRVQLDADFNEQTDIQDHLCRTEAKDVIGACGVPQHEGGFEIVVESGDRDLKLTQGRIYVDGILCENEADVPLTAQPDIPGATLPQDPALYLFYLDVWHRHLTALDDSHIREVALGGPDTASRVKTVWQVRYTKLSIEPASLSDDPCRQRLDEWDRVTAVRRARLAAQAEPGAEDTDPCLARPRAGYRGLENQLYRVEIHKPGPVGVATFKWSRDNGSFARAIEMIAGDTITVRLPGCDTRCFVPGDWVEVVDDAHELNGKPGAVARVATVEDGTRVILDPGSVTDGPIDSGRFPPEWNPKLRRWNHAPGATTAETETDTDWLPLEDGIEVRFGTGDVYETGDYWLIPARTATGSIEWPRDAAGAPEFQGRLGIVHHYCRLAILELSAAAAAPRWVSRGWDCRRLFPPLTELPELGREEPGCLEFLDELRADGVVRGADGELGFAIGTPPGADPLEIAYGAGIAYVAGCRHAVAAGRVMAEPSTTHQTVLVNAQGAVELVSKGELPEKYAALYVVSTFAGRIQRVVDVRFDLTHLDRTVETHAARIAARRADRRQFVPLLAYTLPGLRYEDGRNASLDVPGAAGLAFDGGSMWVGQLLSGRAGAGISTKITRVDRASTGGIEISDQVDTEGRLTAYGAYDGESVWFTAPFRVGPAGSPVPHSEVLSVRTGDLSIDALTVGDRPVGIAFDGDFVWVANFGSSSLSVIDVDTRRVIRTVALRDATGGSVQPRVLTYDGAFVWVAARDIAPASPTGYLFRVQKPWGEPEAVANLAVAPTALAFDGSHLWIAQGEDEGGPVLKLDVTAPIPAAPLELEGFAGTQGLVFDGSHMWLLARIAGESPRIYKADSDTNQHLGSVDFGSRAPVAAAFDGTHLWFSWGAAAPADRGVLRLLVG